MSTHSIGIDPPQFDVTRNELSISKEVAELAVQIDENQQSYTKMKDNFLQEDSRLTCSEEPILQIHANLMDSNRAG